MLNYFYLFSLNTMSNLYPFVKVTEAVNFWAIKELRKRNLNFDPNSSAFIQLKNHQSKIITSCKRVISFSKNFKIPLEHQKGFDKLKLAITKGENLNPYLSRRLYDANFVDGMLDYFECYHFHLGDKKKGKFIKGTSLLAIAMVNSNEVFFIDVLPHGESTWNNIDLIEIVHNERPDLIAHFKCNLFKNTSHDVTTTQEIKQLKKNGYNFPITLKDGTFYMPAKGGQVSTGNNNAHFAISLYDQNLHLCRTIHQNIIHLISELINENKYIIHNYLLSDFESDNDANLTNFSFTVFYMKSLKYEAYKTTFNF